MFTLHVACAVLPSLSVTVHVKVANLVILTPLEVLNAMLAAFVGANRSA